MDEIAATNNLKRESWNKGDEENLKAIENEMSHLTVVRFRALFNKNFLPADFL